MRIAALARGLLDLLAPRDCPACGLGVPPGEEGFCLACRPLVELTDEDTQPPAENAGLFVFGGPLADAIRHVKYGRRSEHLPFLGRLFADGAAAPYFGKVDVIVPVPLHPRRLRARGFDQTALLCRPLARALDVPLDLGRLRRIRDTPPQAALPHASRPANIRAAFRARPTTDRPRILLIDDVRTTGATLQEAAQALAPFASSISTLTFATSAKE